MRSRRSNEVIVISLGSLAILSCTRSEIQKTASQPTCIFKTKRSFPCALFPPQNAKDFVCITRSIIARVYTVRSIFLKSFRLDSLIRHS